MNKTKNQDLKQDGVNSIQTKTNHSIKERLISIIFIYKIFLCKGFGKLRFVLYVFIEYYLDYFTKI